MSVARSEQYERGKLELELFGQPLKAAPRDRLRKTILENGLLPDRIDGTYWMDFYKANGSPDGASTFQVGYLANGDTFAFAMYVFPGGSDDYLWVNVTNTVMNKYGRPSSQAGSERMGPIEFRWELLQGTYIQASRVAPEAPIYLAYIDSVAFDRMKAEIVLARQLGAKKDERRAP